MRILMISDRYAPETRSVAHLFQDLAEGLVKRGEDVVVMTKMPLEHLPCDGRVRHTNPPAIDHLGGVKIIRVRGLFSTNRSIFCRALDQIYLALRVLWRALRNPTPHVVVVYSPPLPLALASALYGKWKGVPYILNLHDLYPRTAIELGVLNNRLLIWGAQILEDFACKAASQIIVPAPESQRVLTKEKDIPEKKVHLVFNWVDTHSIVPGPKDNGFRDANALSGLFVVSYAGLMGLAQDLSTIIECAGQMQEQRDVVFLLVGDGVYAERWRRLAQGLENIRIMPSVSRDVYLDVLRASDVCLVPLAADLQSPAIPGKMQSIMAVGRPVIAIVPPTGSAAEMVRMSRCGFVVAPGKIADLKKVLLDLQDNSSLGDELGSNGRRYAESHFNLASALSAVEVVLKKAMQS